MKKLPILIIILLFHRHTSVFSQAWHDRGETRLNTVGIAIYQPNCIGASLVRQDTFKISGPKIFKLPPDTASRPAIFRCGATFPGPPPLLIVDGMLSKYDQLNELDPNNILSIEILKNIPALSMCNGQVNGVILITTKKSKTFVIKDFLDHKPISRATIILISITDSMNKQVLVSDGNGIVKIEKNVDPANYNLTVSAIGYKSFLVKLKNQARNGINEILLDRDYKNCQEVIVSSTVCWFTHCGVCGAIIKANSTSDELPTQNIDFNLYPNPIRSNSTLTIELNQKQNVDHLLQLFNQSGQLIFSKNIYVDEKATQYKMSMPSIIAGNYFLRLTSKATGKSYTEKLIVD